jgi:hypothetical protein
LYGYYLINYLQTQQDRHLESLLDKNSYNEKDLVYIKIPVHLPYYNSYGKFEKISGSVDINGIVYNYVKRRILNDTLELACLPNFDHKKYESLKDSFLKWNSDNQSNHQDKKSLLNIQNISPEFCNRLITYNFSHCENQILHAGLANVKLIPSRYMGKPEHPPQEESVII